MSRLTSPETSWSPEQIAAGVAARHQSTSATPSEVLDAIVPPVTKVAGLHLQPIHLGTILLLERINSLFVVQGQQITMRDVTAAHQKRAIIAAIKAAAPSSNHAGSQRTNTTPQSSSPVSHSQAMPRYPSTQHAENSHTRK